MKEMRARSMIGYTGVYASLYDSSAHRGNEIQPGAVKPAVPAIGIGFGPADPDKPTTPEQDLDGGTRTAGPTQLADY